MTSRKIIVISPAHYEEAIGGAELQIKYLINTLTNFKNVGIFYITKYYNSPLKNNNHALFSLKRCPKYKKYRYELFDWVKLLLLLYKIKPDSIYVRVATVYLAVVVIAKKVLLKDTKVIYNVALASDLTPNTSSANIFDWLERILFNYGIRNADIIVVQAKYQQELALRYFKKKSVIIPNFHPMHDFGKKHATAREISILWVANIKQSKRPELFIQLAEKFQDRKMYNFHMIGKLDHSPWANEIERNLTKTRNITYHGAQSVSYVNKMMGQAMFFVNTSKIEGYPNTFIQAMQANAIILSYEINPDDIFSNRRLGLLCTSIEQMKQAILEYSRQPLKRDKITDNAYKYVQSNHSMENAMKLAKLLL